MPKKKVGDEEQTYRLKDQTTSFIDDETGLTVTRDEKVKIGPGKGRRTVAMIKSGGLIAVDSSAAESGGEKGNGNGQKNGGAQTQTGAIPDTFPGAKALAEGGVKTFEDLRKLDAQQVIDVKGIGPKTAEEIEKALGR